MGIASLVQIINKKYYSPATESSLIIILGLPYPEVTPLSSRSFPTSSILFSKSKKFPAIVICFIAPFKTPFSIFIPSAAKEKSPVTAFDPE